jgi:hypothetical protein
MDTVDNSQGYNNQYAQQEEQQYPSHGMTQDWRANISPDLQNIAGRFNTPESLVKAYRDAQGLIGKRVGEFSQQDWQSYAAIQQQIHNVPASMDGYNIDTGYISEDRANTFSEDDVDALKEMSHALGLNNDQAQGMYDVLNEMNNCMMEYQEEAAAEYTFNNLSELEQDWGNAYESKLQAVSNCVDTVLPQLTGISAERIKQEVYESGAQHSALLMNIFAAIGELGSEGRSAGYNNLGPMDANMRLAHLKSDPNTASIMANPRHAMHHQVKEEFRALMAIKNGEY